MKQLGVALNNVVTALRASKLMLRDCRWYQFKRKYQLRGASEILESMYELLYHLALEASADKPMKEPNEPRE